MARARRTPTGRTAPTNEAQHDWDVRHPAVWPEVVHGEDRAITLRHPTYPFLRISTGSKADLERIAAAYLRKVAPVFGLPTLLKPTGSSFVVNLSWLEADDRIPAPPRSSVWLRRHEPPPGRGLLDRTLVFLAVESREPNQPKAALGSRLGIRIVALLSRSRGRHWEVRITSSSCSRDLARDFPDVRSAAATAFLNEYLSASGLEKLLPLISTAVGRDAKTPISVDGFRIGTDDDDQAFGEIYAGLAREDRWPLELPAATTLQFRFTRSGLDLVVVEQHLHVARLADVPAKLFLQDPASKAGVGHLDGARRNRAGGVLKRFLERGTLPDLTPVPGGGYTLVDGAGQVRVLRSRLVDSGANDTQPQVEDPSAVDDPRTNPFAAISGYQHARGLFDTMVSYGLRPRQYFKLASLPLRVRYRATISPGPGKDGKTINAQVDYDPPVGHIIGVVWNPAGLRPLQLRLALADLERSTSRREPLGLAAEPRWSWHEYSHVLLGASTGALELRFVHSVGDALAAIMCDPESALATPPPAPLSDRPVIHRRMRGLTFPWVYLSRRHDRSVYDGWSWCGSYHRPAQFSAGGNHGPIKGYLSEQILSTSLFRFYRAIGGETSLDAAGKPDAGARRRAADYAAYLILRAIGTLGPAAWVPAETPDQLVTALVDADAVTMPATGGPLRGRVGGWAHKVLRWAFEAQGLYATTDPLTVVDAPGLPPPIDVFIDDRRPDVKGHHSRGGYAPVSLDWGVTVDPPRWHATETAMYVENHRAHVKVRNRGALDATGVRVGVWYAHWPRTAPHPPAWNTSAWTPLPEQGPKTVKAWPAAAVPFGPYGRLPAPTPSTAVVVVAAATCDGDPANVDPSTHLPCSTEPTPVVDVVSGDNNVGLIVLRHPRP